jgi:hypothetical protein
MRQAQDVGPVLTAFDETGTDRAGLARPAPAVFCIVGLPGPLADWCGTVLARLAARETGEAVQTFPAHSLADLGRRLLIPSSLPGIAMVQYPDAGLCDALTADTCRFLLLIAPPEAAIETSARDHGIPVAEATRAIANAQATTARLRGAPGALVVAPSAAADPGALASAIAAHFGMEPVLAEVPPAPAATAAPPCADGAPPDWRALIGDALAGQSASPLSAGTLAAAALRPLEDRGAVVWPRDLFWGGAPAAPATGAIDLTGPSRCVLYGPYIRLPAGHWSCTLLFGCSPEAVGLAMMADIHAGRVLSQVGFTIEEAGIFEVEIAFENTDPDLPIEVRLFSTRATFEGRLAIGHATLTPLAAKRLKAR